ncbi:hypothetical protein HanXRQr2_Chr17g0829941 [Helianthus annuus]|uniref:Uncharacterized protein n=1 Tax=Helianthus annuus TaxID=4232 RepID=A0A9K3DMF9_HELAN|nr:hypothetical protein HanXRQr2_Chr17g0829941 [Helianthus annuus]
MFNRYTMPYREEIKGVLCARKRWQLLPKHFLDSALPHLQIFWNMLLI